MEGGWGTGKCLAATLPQPPTLFSPLNTKGRGGREKTESTHMHTHTHTHTHGVCSIYSKASRALARCTKRKLSCRPEINYRVSRGWIRKGWFLCCNNALRAANLRKYHLDSFGFGQRERESSSNSVGFTMLSLFWIHFLSVSVFSRMVFEGLERERELLWKRRRDC